MLPKIVPIETALSVHCDKSKPEHRIVLERIVRVFGSRE
jgi:hypothetical protein